MPQEKGDLSLCYAHRIAAPGFFSSKRSFARTSFPSPCVPTAFHPARLTKTPAAPGSAGALVVPCQSTSSGGAHTTRGSRTAERWRRRPSYGHAPPMSLTPARPSPAPAARQRLGAKTAVLLLPPRLLSRCDQAEFQGLQVINVGQSSTQQRSREGQHKFQFFQRFATKLSSCSFAKRY